MNTTEIDFSLALLRSTLGIVILAHGLNHVFGGGKLAGTAGWFDSLGMRPGRLHAAIASVTEIGAGLLLLLGLLTPLACAGVIGTMTVAGITAHRKNGFFIFRPGQGYEYVLVLTLSALALAGLGPGGWSLDARLDVFSSLDWTNLAVAGAAGFGGAAVILAVFWRPASSSAA